MSLRLIQIIVDVTGVKPTVKTPRLLLENKDAPDPLPVIIGDTIGWYVLVATNAGRKHLPYTVTFHSKTADPSDAFFGVATISVPAGGSSPLLPVKALKGRTKYSVEVAGLGTVIDPDIQTGDDLIFSAERVPSQFTITWDVDNQALYVRNGANPPQPFPDHLDVVNHDSVTFTAQSARPLPPIYFVFPPAQNGFTYASPFDENASSFGPAPTAANPVSDPYDIGDTFVFVGQDKNGNKIFGDYNMKLVPAPKA